MFGWLKFYGRVLLLSGCMGGAPRAAPGVTCLILTFQISMILDLEMVWWIRANCNFRPPLLPVSAEHKSTWKHAHTRARTHTQEQCCLIDPFDNRRAQSSLGDGVYHLAKEEPWQEGCGLSQTLCWRLGNRGGRQGFPRLKLIAGRGLSWKEERSVTLDNTLASTFLGSCGPEDFFSLPSKRQYNDTLPPGLHPL